MVDETALRRFSSSNLVFACQYHSGFGVGWRG